MALESHTGLMEKQDMEPQDMALTTGPSNPSPRRPHSGRLSNLLSYSFRKYRFSSDISNFL